MYGAMKLIRRSRCASHTRCCDIDVARSQTARDQSSDDIVLKVLAQLRPEKPEKGEEKKAPDD